MYKKSKEQVKISIKVDSNYYYQPEENGIRNLMLAMIERAFLDLYSPVFSESHSAKYWLFFAKDPKLKHPFSLEWCCHHLGWSAKEFRKKLLKRVAGEKPRLYNLRRVRTGQIQKADKALIH